MKQEIALTHEFVQFIPEDLKAETIYISIRFATVSHLCVCGCENKVVTPLKPTDWKLIFDGKTISLDPSIGNWSFPCQSHYWIRSNKVHWADQWSNERIEAGRTYNRRAKDRYFGIAETSEQQPAERTEAKVVQEGLWQKLTKWLRS